MPQPALLFSGQGSQKSGMGRDLAEFSTDAMNLWKQAEQTARLPLREIFWEGDESAMSDTRALQPALSVVNLNLWSALAGKITPRGTAGHSLGEFSALAAAGALSFKETLEITALRGRLMSEADSHAKGGMAAIVKLPLEQVQAIVEEITSTTNGPLIIANHNTPVQFVVSGAKETVSRACDKARERKGHGIELKVSGAFHSLMMQEADRELAVLLRKARWQKPRFPVYCNSNGQAVYDAESAQNAVLAQMTSPVLWIDTLRNQYADGVRSWLEIGPKALLGKMIAPCLVESDMQDIRILLVNTLETVQQFSL
ncbi:MAG: malonyl CoA-acyl carrier protein transacylase [Candidatus Desulfovibrio kirbyi]|uniref:Malonyl CoA-acyl carrier protein transacylase n=1 Tax=Candidatus Desulfovibrio kirbyi TaxID=2696086 RepID=A0A6L2R637_9BACT|nr:MAG: malonyl CoA-acyl carrier protein transacylase [Candidatus Desulfovibrio kirbyi]